MKFKWVMPIVGGANDFRIKIEKIPNPENFIVIDNLDDPYVSQIGTWARKEYGVEYHRPKVRMGVAGAWNFGLRRMVEDDFDCVVVVSNAVRFMRPVQLFLDRIEDAERHADTGLYFPTSEGLGWHMFVITRFGFELGGFFDENFWPAYLEDADYLYRGKFNGLSKKILDMRLSAVGMVEEDKRAVNLSDRCKQHHLANIPRIYRYYKDKWGGHPHEETFDTPFNGGGDVNWWHANGFGFHGMPRHEVEFRLELPVLQLPNHPI